MTLCYTLDDHGTPVPCDDPLDWAIWMAENPDRRVAQDMDEGEGRDRVRVSTVFIGVDMGMPGFDDAAPPLLWETMVFGGPLDLACRRYTSRDAALAGHQRMCAKVREAQTR